MGLLKNNKKEKKINMISENFLHYYIYTTCTFMQPLLNLTRSCSQSCIKINVKYQNKYYIYKENPS